MDPAPVYRATGTATRSSGQTCFRPGNTIQIFDYPLLIAFHDRIIRRAGFTGSPASLLHFNIHMLISVSMKSNNHIKFAFLILVVGTMLLSGCMESKSVNPEGEWIILPATDESAEYMGYSSVCDKPTGDYQGLVIGVIPGYVLAESGENVSIDVKFTNKGEAPIVIDNFPPEFLIKNPADLSNPARITRGYMRGNVTETIATGESVVHTIEWDQRNDRGLRVAPAIYVLEITNVMRYDGRTETIKRGSIGEEIAEITVRPAGGTLEGTIPVKQSKTDEGVTFTFESIDATSDYVELVFSADAEGPDYVGVMDDGREWTYTLSPEYEPIHGFYRIDDGKIQYLWKVESTSGKDFHYEYRYRIGPLPKDTANLSVTIDGLGAIPALWEYNITF
ncbi:MAG: hypothetical protein KC400_09840 [Methanolinea sp.]|nr:hypothetical protein [Methanolinea sp.]